MSNRAAFSVVGVFDSPQALMNAIPRIKGKSAGHVEAYTPYPIEGIDKLLGLRKSPVGGMVFVMGIIGEYIGKIYIEVQKRPLYLLREKSGWDETDEHR